MSELADLLAQLNRLAEELPPGEAPGFIGALEAVKARALARLLSPPLAGNGPPESSTQDRLLTVEEAARKLGMSEDWCYRQAKRLPFAVRIGRQLRFSERGIERYIRGRQGR